MTKTAGSYAKRHRLHRKDCPPRPSAHIQPSWCEGGHRLENPPAFAKGYIYNRWKESGKINAGTVKKT
ncbi:hypothetical protein [Hoylesella timonensis]|uniref:hypothetical protein n=1 Tax=Hoylesella timonensis TaxID=386414 RepID=UPI00288C5A18|nr:hypothetical protein [Hoylesella timonensis]